ncbi:MAG: cytochrome c biogenesis protein CcsA [Polyangiales bacterium]
MATASSPSSASPEPSVARPRRRDGAPSSPRSTSPRGRARRGADGHRPEDLLPPRPERVRHVRRVGRSAVGGLLFRKRSDAGTRSASRAPRSAPSSRRSCLVTGPLWGRKAWGVLGVDPRITSTLLTAMIYGSFLALRSFGAAGQAEKRFAAALAIVGFPLLFLIKYSVQRWSGQHPIVLTGAGGGIHEDMVPALICFFLAITGLVVWLLWTRIRIERHRQEIVAIELEAARRGLGGES